MASTTKPKPLVAILGSTGTGKSKLAVDLATKFNGEIINADAVQMYRGLPIATNKIPDHERNGIPHHLLDVIDLHESPWTVIDFVNEATKAVEQIQARGKLPIVVGGTNYYIYSLLFNDATVGNVPKLDIEGPDSEAETTSSKFPILNEPTSAIYAKLQEVDPEIAQRWHPNDRRKLQRSLEIWLSTGRKASEIYAEQKVSEDTANETSSSTLRYDPLLFWIDAQDTTLKQRLDDRVEAMVEGGLLDEIKIMHNVENEMRKQGRQVDTSKGVWISIGYKELALWLENAQSQDDSPEHDGKVQRLRADGVEAVKAATRQYAKGQRYWVRIKVARALERAQSLHRLLLVDGTDVNEWATKVKHPSERALDAFLNGDASSEALQDLSQAALARVKKDLTRPDQKAHYCETCRRTLMTMDEWSNHLKSRGHRQALEGIRKRAAKAAYFAKVAHEAQASCTSSAGPDKDDTP